jgi:hypothetical protein
VLFGSGNKEIVCTPRKLLFFSFLSDATNFPTKGLRSKRRNFSCVSQVVESLSTDSFLMLIIVTTHSGTDRLSLYFSHYIIILTFFECS